MCKVKSGENIKTKADFQNMVIGIILRQENKYKEQDIFNLVEFYSKGSLLSIDSLLIKDVVRDNLDFLQRNNRLVRMDGIYTPLTIEQY